MLKKILILIFIGSLGANFYSLFILDKALFYRANLRHFENLFPNQGLHIRTVKELKETQFNNTAAFIGGSFVRYWFFDDQLPIKISNQGGVEDQISEDLEKVENDILGSGVDYVFINSGFCEIRTAVITGKDVDAVIHRNFMELKKIVQLLQEDGIIPVLTTLTPVRPVFIFPYMRVLSINSNKKDVENLAYSEYNERIRQYAKQNNILLIDFHAAMKDQEGYLKKEFSITDGEHITYQGYRFLNLFFRDELGKLINS